MSHAVQASRLKAHIASLETMTRFVLATLALASGVYTYLGVRSLLDGSATVVFFAAIIYSVAVSVAIYGFWTYLIRFLPEMRDAGSRLALFGIMAIGSLMIVAMSSWLNAAALAGSAAVEQHLAVTLEDYTADLDQAHSNALGALSLLPDIQRASERFARLAADEQATGALTGTSGSGSVVQLLSQMSAQMDELEATIEGSRDTIKNGFADGQARLAAMRALVSAPGAIAQRSDQFAAEAVALAGVIAALEQTSIAPSVMRAAADLSVGFIAPVADGGTSDLAGRQDQVMATIRTSVEAQSKALSAAAGEILAQPKVPERRYIPLTSAEAVLRYASDFIPSWAGAISIDLLPAVLVGIMAVVHGAMRRGEDHLEGADRITAGDMMRSLELHETLLARRQSAKSAVPDEDKPETSPETNPGSEERGHRPERHPTVARRQETERAVNQTPANISAETLPGTSPRHRNRLVRYLSRFDDGEVVRWAFLGMLVGAIGVLALDLRDLSEKNGWLSTEAGDASAHAGADPAASRRDRITASVHRSAAACHRRRSAPVTAYEFRAGDRRGACRGRQYRAWNGGALCVGNRSARGICTDRLAEFARRRA